MPISLRALLPAEDLGHRLLIATDLQAGRVTVAGGLTRITARRLLDLLEALPLSAQHSWTVDVARVTFCDVAGLRVLARAEALVRSRGRTLLLVRPEPFLMYSLVLVGMQRLVDPSLTQAAGALPTHRPGLGDA